MNKLVKDSRNTKNNLGTNVTTGKGKSNKPVDLKGKKTLKKNSNLLDKNETVAESINSNFHQDVDIVNDEESLTPSNAIALGLTNF